MAEETAPNRRFRENMRHIREEKGWSQGELSRRLLDAGWGVFHQTTITRIENGTRQVRLDEAMAIANALGVTLETMTLDAKAGAVLAAIRQATVVRKELSILGLRYVDAQHQLLKALEHFTGELEPEGRAMTDQILQETAGDAALETVQELMEDIGVDDYSTFIEKRPTARRRRSLSGINHPPRLL
ncbi:helix-turn-helix transcriptional regulator [Kocuria sp. LHG3120]|uniref:helix-turn-helix transcriptional regulator n=1 Tax=Kocuria sp. LHG3120 TaxID=2804590 RepID=UPI003CEE5BF3